MIIILECGLIVRPILNGQWWIYGIGKIDMGIHIYLGVYFYTLSLSLDFFLIIHLERIFVRI